jgi:hypothetical protein
MLKYTLIIAICTITWAQGPTTQPQSDQGISGSNFTKVNQTKQISIPRLFSYQGKLTDTTGAPLPDGTYNLTFRLYNQETGGSPIWTESQTVEIKNGLFSVLLGSVTPIASLPEDGNLFLSLQVENDTELSPRLRIVSSAYSFLSERSANADLLQGKDTTKFAPSYLIGHSCVFEGNLSQDTLFKMSSTGWYIIDDGDSDYDHTLIIGTTNFIAEYTLTYADTVIHGEALFGSPATITFPHYLGFQLTLARRQYIAHLICNENDGYVVCVFMKSYP